MCEKGINIYWHLFLYLSMRGCTWTFVQVRENISRIIYHHSPQDNTVMIKSFAIKIHHYPGNPLPIQIIHGINYCLFMKEALLYE
jgi:hypothetical protein